MTYIRRLKRGENVYLYRNKSSRDRKTGKVKQKSKYLGKEVVRDGKTVVVKMRKEKSVRRVLDSCSYIMYRVAEDFGYHEAFTKSCQDLTRIRNIADKIMVLAISRIVDMDPYT